MKYFVSFLLFTVMLFSNYIFSAATSSKSKNKNTYGYIMSCIASSVGKQQKVLDSLKKSLRHRRTLFDRINGVNIDANWIEYLKEEKKSHEAIIAIDEQIKGVCKVMKRKKNKEPCISGRIISKNKGKNGAGKVRFKWPTKPVKKEATVSRLVYVD